MAKMTNLQIEHARNRLNAISRQVLGPVPERPDSPAGKQFLQAVAANASIPKAALIVAATRALNEDNYYRNERFTDYLAEAFFAKTIEADRKKYEAAMAKYKARSAKFIAEAIKVEDAIVLGESSEALEQLQSLAEYKI